MPSYVMLPLIGTSRIIFVSFSLSIDSTFLWKSSLTTLPTPDWIRHCNESPLSVPTIPQEQGQCRSFSLSHTYCLQTLLSHYSATSLRTISEFLPLYALLKFGNYHVFVF